MKKYFSAFIFFFNIALFAQDAKQFTFTVKKLGVPEQHLTIADLEKLVPPVTVEVPDPVAAEKRSYTGFPMRLLLEKLYGQIDGQIDEVLFTCADGYQPSVPLDLFRDRKAILAYARSDKGPFEFKHETKGTVNLGPLYLVWDGAGLTEEEKKSQNFWAYQVVGVDLISFGDRFPKLAPPTAASPAVKRGFAAFRTYCMTCHKINGQGGDMGPELNYPTSVTQYFDKKFLEIWIDNPKAVRYGAKMEGLSSSVPKRRQVIKEIIAYLDSMSLRKIRPEEKK